MKKPIPLIIILTLLAIAIQYNYVQLLQTPPEKLTSTIRTPSLGQGQDTPAETMDENDAFAQFTNYVDIKRACLSVLGVFSLQQVTSYQLEYLEISLEFIKPKFVLADYLSTEKKTSLRKLLNEIEQDVKCLKNSQGTTDRCTKSALSTLPADRYLIEKLGSWYREVRGGYLQHSSQHQQQCAIRLAEERNKIVKALDDVQTGASCKNSSYVLHSYHDLGTQGQIF